MDGWIARRSACYRTTLLNTNWTTWGSTPPCVTGCWTTGSLGREKYLQHRHDEHWGQVSGLVSALALWALKPAIWSNCLKVEHNCTCLSCTMCFEPWEKLWPSHLYCNGSMVLWWALWILNPAMWVQVSVGQHSYCPKLEQNYFNRIVCIQPWETVRPSHNTCRGSMV